jgi:hypothetical protein
LKKDKTILFKLAGGAAAQTLGLINALYFQQKTNRNFQIKYYPHSTGTYWPFAIDFLLKKDEILSTDAEIHGLKATGSFEVGKIIRDHPLEQRFFSYERLLKWIRKLRLEFILRRLRGEIALEARPKRLERMSEDVQSISGGFVPMLDAGVMRELDNRFRQGRDSNSPFSRASSGTNPYVAIHYRIGDKRAKFTHDKDFGGDGIFDPGSFASILEKNNLGEMKIYVVSDEPHVAQSLLAESGIEANLFRDKHDIWSDLFRLSQAEILIGSWSQVSQLAAVCVAHNGGAAFLPLTTQVGTKVHWSIPCTEFFAPRYLSEQHPIYKPEFELDDDAHKAYRQNLT